MICPICGSLLRESGGVLVCPVCGYIYEKVELHEVPSLYGTGKRQRGRKVS